METQAERKRKHVVTLMVSGFKTAKDAIMFGNTVEHVVTENIGPFKFRQSIGSGETMLAITEDWAGDTMLQMHFLELDREQARFVNARVNRLVALSNNDIEVINVTMKGKPQPQTIDLNYARI